MLNITNMTEEQYHTIEEVAKKLRVVYLTVYRWIQDGRLKAYKAGKQYRIASTELQRFINYKSKSKNNEK